MNSDPHDAGDASKKSEDCAKEAETEKINLPIQELLTPEFLQSFSSFQNVTEMFAKSGFFIETAEDFARIPEHDWDAFVRAKTSFSSWKEMGEAAGLYWARNRVAG
jgi:hypothetical protein